MTEQQQIHRALPLMLGLGALMLALAFPSQLVVFGADAEFWNPESLPEAHDAAENTEAARFPLIVLGVFVVQTLPAVYLAATMWGLMVGLLGDGLPILRLFLPPLIFTVLLMFVLTSSVFIYGNVYAQEAEQLRLLLRLNSHWWRFNFMASATFFMLLGYGTYRLRCINPRISLFIIAAAALQFVFTVLSANGESELSRTNPQIIPLGVMLVVLAVHLYLRDHATSTDDETPTTHAERL